MKKYYRDKTKEYKRRVDDKILQEISDIKRKNIGPPISIVEEANNSKDEVTNDGVSVQSLSPNNNIKLQ